MQAWTVCYTDGRSAAHQRGQVWLGKGVLYFVDALDRIQDWAPQAVERINYGSSLSLRHRKSDICFEVENAGLIEAVYQSGFGPGLKLSSGHKKAMAISLLVLSLFLIVFAYRGLVPLSEKIAHSLDRESEQKIFHSIIGPNFFADERCYSPAAESVMNGWIARLDPKNETGARAIIVDWNMANAFALPGGLIVFTDDLINESVGAAELVGIMGHELEHSRHRDSLASLVRNSLAAAFWAIVFGDYTGAFVLDPTVVKQIGEMSFSRDVEARADREAVKSLEASGMEALSLAKILERVAPDPKGWKRTLQSFMSHPLTSDRTAKIRESARLKESSWNVSNADYKSLLQACTSPGENDQR